MKHRKPRNDGAPKMIVEYVPGKRRTRQESCRYYYHSTRPFSPFRFALLTAAGLAVFCVLLAIGSAILLLALGTVLVYTVWRRLSGKG